MKLIMESWNKFVNEEEQVEEGIMDKIKGFFGKDEPAPEPAPAPTPEPEPEPAPEPSFEESSKYNDAVRIVKAARSGLRRTTVRKFVELSDISFPMVKQSLEYIREFEKKYGPQNLWDGKSQGHFSVSDFYEFEREYELAQQLHRDRERRARARGEIKEAKD
jgi:hypothetical protein